jgi:hypothetical protein
MTGQRFMYYIPWCITDAANIACGISFNTYVLDRGSKQATWDYIYAVEIMGIEAGIHSFEDDSELEPHYSLMA